MTITNNYLTHNRPRTKRSKTTAVAVHWVGNPNSSAIANRNYFQTTSTSVSSNYIVGLQGEVICCIPDEEISWCTNQANSYTVSIETCHPDSTGKFNTATYNSLVELTAMLCKKYGLNPQKDGIIRHFDVTKKVCPKWFVASKNGGSDSNTETNWYAFKVAVAAKMNGTSSSDSTPSKQLYRVRRSWSDSKSQLGAYSVLDNAKAACKTGYTVYDESGKAVYTPSGNATGTYLVKVTCDALNIRAGAGTNHKIIGCIRDKGTYTIVQTSGNWGKLKSGTGWICLTGYTKIV